MIAGTLHERLNAYIKQIEVDGGKVAEGKLFTSERKRLSLARNLNRHNDCSLTCLNSDRVQKLIAFWRSRPPTEEVSEFHADMPSITSMN